MTPSRQNNPVEPSSGREAAPAPERGKGPAGRRPRLNLPFDNRREDAGSWAYDHRVGLCVTLIAYLVVMIVFVSSKIVIGQRAQTQGMFIDLQTLSELEEQREQLEEEVRQRQQDAADWASIRNRMSNENAAEGELRDDRGTDMRPPTPRSGCGPTARPTSRGWPRSGPSASGGAAAKRARAAT